ncbi:MAG: hypothetical protein H7A36_03900 [Chlamydiales bacterium]|nr:hypothetical protein [Chlamydiales bacterium]
MLVHRRALYNMMHFADPRELEEVEPWQLESYRPLSEDELFGRLRKLAIEIPTLSSFMELAQDYESPDELCESIARKREPLEQDQIYLALFELWRRHLPEKRCPSVFCDELDYQFSQYEKGNLELQEELQEIIDYFEQILDDHVDEGADPQQVLKSFQMYCAHQLERFLYQYTLDAIESNNIDYAYDLIDGFYRYLSTPIWFDFLYAHVEVIKNPKKGVDYLERIIKKVQTLDLAEEMLIYFAKERNHPLFCQLALKTLSLLECEEDFKEFLDMCALHSENLELEAQKNAFNALLKKRAKVPFDAHFDKKDDDVKEVKKLINQKLPIEQ